MFWFFALAASVDQSKYRKCHDSPFCKRNRVLQNRKWEVIGEENGIIEIHDGLYNQKLNLYVKFLGEEMVNIRIEPKETESFVRYDASKEDSIVNQTFIQFKKPYNVTKNNTHISLISKKSRVIIQKNPFIIIIFNNEEEIMRLNEDDSAVFETKRSIKDDKSLFEKANFGGILETLKDGPKSVGISFKFSRKGTKFSGLPSHTLPITLQNTNDKEPIRFFNTDINSFVHDSPMSMYGAIPFLIGHTKNGSIGVFWCNPSETWVDINDDKSRFISESGFIDIFLMIGSHKSVTSMFSDLTGHPNMPQQFLFGYHQCRWTYYTSTEIREVSKKLDEALIPHDVMWMDLDHTDGKRYFTFHPENYKDVTKLQREFADQKRRLVAQVDPHLKVESSYRVYSEASARGFLIKDMNGKELVANCWPGKSSWVDFLNPDAREWWALQFNFSLYRGSTKYLFTWNDMNEPAVFDVPDITIPRDSLHINSIEDRDVHNLYGHFMVKATYNGHLNRVPGKNERPFVLTRSFFAGSQKYSLMWTGDNTANWEQLRCSISQTLSLGICAYPYSGSDVGGFFNSPEPELLMRWYQVGAWTYPFFRCHCHHLSARREPFELPGDSMNVARTAIVERYQILPLWYTSAYHSFITGEPIIRPLWYEFDDPEIEDDDTCVMLSNCLLIAPIIEKGQKNREVFFPRFNRWYEFRSLREIKKSGERVSIKNCNLVVPVYIKGGSIITTKPKLRKSSIAMFDDPYNLIVACDFNQSAFGDLFIDDGHTFNYEKGFFIHRLFKFNGNTLSNQCYSKQDSNQFFERFSAVVSRIQISGLEKMPVSIINDEGKEIKFEEIDNILNIFKAELPIKSDWKLTFKYE